eukprot:INCI6047.2.p2 GENE.INCI6047.2~~INCI6047.2.p2  ORF type:complete len:136 (+),score=11.50 INCI6047.2:702-1109(+)
MVRAANGTPHTHSHKCVTKASGGTTRPVGHNLVVKAATDGLAVAQRVCRWVRAWLHFDNVRATWNHPNCLNGERGEFKEHGDFWNAHWYFIQPPIRNTTTNNNGPPRNRGALHDLCVCPHVGRWASMSLPDSMNA